MDENLTNTIVWGGRQMGELRHERECNGDTEYALAIEQAEYNTRLCCVYANKLDDFRLRPAHEKLTLWKELFDEVICNIQADFDVPILHKVYDFARDEDVTFSDEPIPVLSEAELLILLNEGYMNVAIVINTLLCLGRRH